MQALLEGISEKNKPCTDKSTLGLGGQPSLDELEQRYRSAEARLLVAQDEKTWATSEFIAARAALHRTLEDIWPDPNEQ